MFLAERGPFQKPCQWPLLRRGKPITRPTYLFSIMLSLLWFIKFWIFSPGMIESLIQKRITWKTREIKQQVKFLPWRRLPSLQYPAFQKWPWEASEVLSEWRFRSNHWALPVVVEKKSYWSFWKHWKLLETIGTY